MCVLPFTASFWIVDVSAAVLIQCIVCEMHENVGCVIHVRICVSTGGEPKNKKHWVYNIIKAVYKSKIILIYFYCKWYIIAFIKLSLLDRKLWWQNVIFFCQVLFFWPLIKGIINIVIYLHYRESFVNIQNVSFIYNQWLTKKITILDNNNNSRLAILYYYLYIVWQLTYLTRPSL